MATRPTPLERTDPADDEVWNTAWGNPALRSLGRYLVASGVSLPEAAVVVEQLWLFYSYVAVPILSDRPPLGIVGTAAIDRPVISILLPASFVREGPFDQDRGSRFEQLHIRFGADFAEPLAGTLDLQLTMLTVADAPELLNPSTARQFLGWLTRWSRLHDFNVIGVFVDDLAAELPTVMDAADVSLWLETPNSLFGGNPPGQFLLGPASQILRDVITRAKFNLPAA